MTFDEYANEKDCNAEFVSCPEDTDLAYYIAHTDTPNLHVGDICQIHIEGEEGYRDVDGVIFYRFKRKRRI